MAQRGWQAVEVTFLQVFNVGTAAATRPFCRVWVEGHAQPAHVTEAQPLRRAMQWTDPLLCPRVPYGAKLMVEVADAGDDNTPLGVCAIQLSAAPVRPPPGPAALAAVQLTPGVPVELEVGLQSRRAGRPQALPAHVFLTMVAGNPVVLAPEPPSVPVLGTGSLPGRSRAAPTLQRGGSKKALMALRTDRQPEDPWLEVTRRRRLLEDGWMSGWRQLFQEEILAWAGLCRLHHLQRREAEQRHHVLREEAVGLMDVTAQRMLWKGYEALMLTQEHLAQARRVAQQWAGTARASHAAAPPAPPTATAQPPPRPASTVSQKSPPAPPSGCTSPVPPSTCASPAPPSACASPAPPAGYASPAPPAGYASPAPPAGYASPAPPAGYASPAPPAGYASPAPPAGYASPAPPAGSYSRLLDECLAARPPQWAVPVAPPAPLPAPVRPRRASLEGMGLSEQLADLMLQSYSESDYLRQLLNEKDGQEGPPAAQSPTAPVPQQALSPTARSNKSPGKRRQVTFVAAETPKAPCPGDETPTGLETLDQTARQIVEAYRRWEESASQLARWY